MSKLIDLTVREFCDTLASDAPAPGGGSAAALAGVHSAGLLAMYCRLTIGKKKYAEVEQKMKDSLVEIERARTRLMELVDLDTDAFNKVMDAFRMPKESDDEKAARTEAIQAGMKGAAEVPLEVCTWAVRLIQIARLIHKDGNKNALSDCGVAVQLAMASFSGAALNVYINLDSIKDEAFAGAAKKQVHDLETQARSMTPEIATYIYTELGVS